MTTPSCELWSGVIMCGPCQYLVGGRVALPPAEVQIMGKLLRTANEVIGQLERLRAEVKEVKQ